MPTFTQLPSGSWRAQVRKRGMYASETFPLKRDAEAWATQKEAQINQSRATGGYLPPPKGTTIADLLDKYDEVMGEGNGAATTQRALNKIRAYIGKVPLTSFSRLTLGTFIDKRTHEDKVQGQTIAIELTSFNAVLKWARHVLNLDLPETAVKDAMASFKHRRLSRKSIERDRKIKDEELERLFAYWDKSPQLEIPMPLITRVAVATALRQGEITRIRVCDVHGGDKPWVLVTDRKHPTKKKGNHKRVPLLPPAWALIEPLVRGKDKDDKTRLFPYVTESVSAAWTRACSNLGIEDATFHDLRHKAAQTFINMGMSIPAVATITGHESWEMLRRYVDEDPEATHDEYERVMTLQAQTVAMKQVKAEEGAAS